MYHSEDREILKRYFTREDDIRGVLALTNNKQKRAKLMDFLKEHPDIDGGQIIFFCVALKHPEKFNI